MKKMFLSIIAALVLALIVIPEQTFASDSDTLVVYASGASLDEIIPADTTSAGLQAHKVYKLVSLDTTYIYLGDITVKNDIVVMGVRGSDGRPPCIQPGVLSDGSMPEYGFVLTGEGTKCTFKDLYLYGTSVNGSNNWGIAILVSADDISLSVEDCVVEQFRGYVIGYEGMWDSFYMTGCKIKNGVYPTDWFSATVICRVYPTSNPADSVVMKDNTIFCINGYAAAMGTDQQLNYFEYTNNTMVYNFIEPFIIFPVVEAKINNNIFYGMFAGAEPKSEYPWWHETFSADIGSIIDIDTLTLAMDSTVAPESISDSNLRMLAEAKRSIEVKNNVFYQPEALTDFWTDWNKTAESDDSLYTASWMNDRTANMFADSLSWPNFVESGNMFVDPGFGTDLLSVLTDDSETDGIVSLINYVKEIREGTASTDVWGYKHQDVTSSSNWVPEWPLAETTDMQYSNTTLLTASTDGGIVGDSYWFDGITDVKETDAAVTNSFALEQNYPNPFNPTTTINFSIPQTDMVSLKVYNILGQEVTTLINKELNAGSYQVSFDASHLASGVYIYTIKAGSFYTSKKMMLLK